MDANARLTALLAFIVLLLIGLYLGGYYLIVKVENKVAHVQPSASPVVVEQVPSAPVVQNVPVVEESASPSASPVSLKKTVAPKATPAAVVE